MLDKNTLEWLEDRKQPSFFCKKYCDYVSITEDGAAYCRFPTFDCPHDYPDMDDNKEFERRVKMYLRKHNDVEDTPCAHGMTLFCPAKRIGAPFLGCWKWCMLREARLHVEQEMDSYFSC